MNFVVQNGTYPLSSLGSITGSNILFSNSTNDSRRTVFSLMPYVGKVINQHWLLGIHLDYDLDIMTTNDVILFGQTDTIDTKTLEQQFGGGFFARYMLNPQNALKVYAEPYAKYNYLRVKSFQNNEITQQRQVNHIDVGIRTGLLYDINQKIRAILRLGYINYVNGSWKIIGEDTSTKFDAFNTNIRLSSISLGLEIKL